MEEMGINSRRIAECVHRRCYLCACNYWPLDLSYDEFNEEPPSQNVHDPAIGVTQAVGYKKGSSTLGPLLPTPF